MNKNLSMFGVSLLILTLITAVILGLMVEPASPLTWLLVAMLVAVPFIYKKLSSRKYLEWKSEYSTGIDSIDQQHKKLVNLINQMQTAVDYSTGEEFEREALDELVSYTMTHFGYEEKLMEDNGYPGYEPHKAEHEKMVKQVDSVLSEYKQNPAQAMQHAHDFLRDWLINHINGIDKAYSSFLIGKGVK